MRIIKFAFYLFAVFFILTLLKYRQLFLMLFPSVWTRETILLFCIGSIFYALHIVSIIGFIMMKRFASIISYLAILIGTLLFSVCYLPGFSDIFFMTPYLLIFSNFFVILLIAGTHYYWQYLLKLNSPNLKQGR